MDVMALYKIEGVELDCNLRTKPVYGIVDKLRNILRNRVFQSDSPYVNVFSERTACDMPDSISSLFHESFWTTGYMELTETCDINSWNRYSDFTYDVTTFSLVARTSLCTGKSISSLLFEDFEEILPEIYYYEYEGDWDDGTNESPDDAEEAEKIYYLILADDCYGFVKELQQCCIRTDWEDLTGEVAVLLKDFSSKIFLSMLSPQQVLENFDALANVSFGAYDGYDRTLYTFGSEKIATVLNSESLLKEHEDFKQLKSCLLFLEQPINSDFEPIVVHNTDYWSVTLLETADANIYSTRPFLKELIEQIEQLTNSLLNCLPEV